MAETPWYMTSAGTSLAPVKKASNTSSSGNSPYNLTPQQAYPASIQQTGEDYDSIMGGYKNLLNRPGGAGGDTSNLTNLYNQLINSPSAQPQKVNYQQSPEFNEAFGNLRGLSQTGGLSEGEQGSLRERGVAPIRAVYANAMRELDRQKALSGGYSPNHAAASAKMARDLSERVGSANTDVNASIAEMVQRGKLSAAPTMAGMGESSNTMRNKVELENAAAARDAENIALQKRLAGISGLTSLSESKRGSELDALRGMTSLYGTTPALTQTFGNQALQAAQQNPIVKRAGIPSARYA
jgi:hypothetical protein